MNNPDFEGIFRVLGNFGVEYFVIGGLAVGYHGFIRGTKDVDIVPSPSPENIARLAAALRDLEAEVQGAGDLKPEELPDPTDETILGEGGNWVLETRLGRLDLLQWIGEWDLWERYSERAHQDQIDGITVKVIGFGDLLEMKRFAGRDQDILDIARLEEARRED